MSRGVAQQRDQCVDRQGRDFKDRAPRRITHASACCRRSSRPWKSTACPYWDGGYMGHPALSRSFTRDDRRHPARADQSVERRQTPAPTTGQRKSTTGSTRHLQRQSPRELRAVGSSSELMKREDFAREYKNVHMQRIDASGRARRLRGAARRAKAEWDLCVRVAMRAAGRSIMASRPHYGAIGYEARSMWRALCMKRVHHPAVTRRPGRASLADVAREPDEGRLDGDHRQRTKHVAGGGSCSYGAKSRASSQETENARMAQNVCNPSRCCARAGAAQGSNSHVGEG